MVLISTSNGKIASLVGKDFVSSHLQGDKYRFSAVGLGKRFESNVKRIYKEGSDCIFVTANSWYRFSLGYCESLVMGCTMVQTI